MKSVAIWPSGDGVRQPRILRIALNKEIVLMDRKENRDIKSEIQMKRL